MRFSKLSMLATVSIFIFTVMVSSTAAQAQTVEWDQIIGIIESGNEVGTGTLGTNKVQGGGQPWSTRRGEARVDLDNGDLKFRVRGLVLAGGNNIGTNPVAMVRGTLVCDTTGTVTDSVLVDTAPVPMSAEGDARFEGTVALDDACDEPDIAFLIRIVGGDEKWIANGAVRSEDD